MKPVQIVPAGLALALCVSLAGCDRDRHDDKGRDGQQTDLAAEEAAVNALEAEALAGFKAKDAARVAAIYDENATVMIAGRPVDVGRPAIQRTIAADIQDPNFTIDFAPAKVSIARSGDFAYARGRYTITFTDPATRAKVTETGNYLGVHRKGEDGKWRIIEDITAPSPAGGAAAPSDATGNDAAGSKGG